MDGATMASSSLRRERSQGPGRAFSPGYRGKLNLTHHLQAPTEQGLVPDSASTGVSSLRRVSSAHHLTCSLSIIRAEISGGAPTRPTLNQRNDMLGSLFNMLGNPGEGFLCYAQGYSSQFFSIASFLWTTTIALSLHRTVVKHKADVEGFGDIFHVYAWGTSLVMTIIPLIGND
ncbi:hypothetical protein M758_5G050100 [Ceratodon purpureus]|nr:hypothetical protein M758_5G050100 [Ceratodon purpureus]